MEYVWNFLSLWAGLGLFAMVVRREPIMSIEHDNHRRTMLVAVLPASVVVITLLATWAALATIAQSIRAHARAWRRPVKLDAKAARREE